MYHILLTLLALSLLTGCSKISGKQMGEGIEECSTNNLGFIIRHQGINPITPTGVDCCTDDSFRPCDFSRLIKDSND